ncbi:hypothetical protein SPBR_08567 [Sporothrix brasiliensis 5110]|uniref:endo-1,3(4)-beta-glucanase n=1 Tax=Sporothrix brasiliensis 5110 TaxID=1398154 RepID=A0A0C2IBH1_9PEZI|nr:uncharacterized protein SPBR_08567 [Sporothrix brasiliensis 5110]KIH86601.1 hypothetical protein SPBR_08567 [Sporothrix brasiliensis 5110]
MKSVARVALASTLLAATAQAASYSLVDNYNNTNFFSGFEFFDAPDPTHGFVEYVDAQTASKSGLAGYVNNMVYLGADHNTANPASGRPSTRITSNKGYEKGLFIADIQHMPVGCGVWPAFWTLGPNWPGGGEIDIIEGVNSQSTDAITLHTAPGCTMSSSGSSSGTKFSNGASTVDCGANGGFEGCSLSTTNTNAYGPAFNENGGGVYVMELTSQAISVWFFARNTAQAASIVSDATPDTSTFGTPMAKFTGCDIDHYFSAQQIVFDTTFCGDWAGKVWDQDSTCAPLASTCEAYVKQNTAAFVDAYWLINSVKVFQAASTGSTKRRSPPKTEQKQKEGIVPVPFMA